MEVNDYIVGEAAHVDQGMGDFLQLIFSNPVRNRNTEHKLTLRQHHYRLVAQCSMTVSISLVRMIQH